MVQISNKPNISGIKDVSEDAEYSSKLLARKVNFCRFNHN